MLPQDQRDPLHGVKSRASRGMLKSRDKSGGIIDQSMRENAVGVVPT